MLHVSWKNVGDDLKFARYADREGAERAADAMSFDAPERSGAVVAAEGDLARDRVPTPVLLAIVNYQQREPSGNVVKKFESRAVGERRAMLRLEEVERGLEVSEPPGPREKSAPVPAVLPLPSKARPTDAEAACAVLGVDPAAIPAPAEPTNEESAMAGKAGKSGRKAKRKPDEMSDRHKRAKEMIERANGATLDELMKEFKCSRGSASNAVSDLRVHFRLKPTLAKVNEQRTAYKFA